MYMYLHLHVHENDHAHVHIYVNGHGQGHGRTMRSSYQDTQRASHEVLREGMAAERNRIYA
jgi:hypothetical protein